MYEKLEYSAQQIRLAQIGANRTRQLARLPVLCKIAMVVSYFVAVGVHSHRSILEQCKGAAMSSNLFENSPILCEINAVIRSGCSSLIKWQWLF